MKKHSVNYRDAEAEVGQGVYISSTCRGPTESGLTVYAGDNIGTLHTIEYSSKSAPDVKSLRLGEVQSLCFSA
jgi:hypothetical protein